MRIRHDLIPLAFVLALAACGGGSGSTGLIDSEGAVIDQVREDGTCADSGGAAFCATNSPDATAPGGQHASVVVASPTPLRTPTPAATGTASAATPTEAGVPTGAGAPTATGGPEETPTPFATASEPSATPTPEARTVQVVVRGFDMGAGCAVAARPDGSTGSWHTGSIVAVDDSTAPVTFDVPDNVPQPSEIVLLCFTTPPASLPAEINTLGETDPTVVFVLPTS